MLQSEATRPGSPEMFSPLAERYDRLNVLLSWGLDRSWRRRTAQALGALGHGTVLDLATGTGELALEIAMAHPEARIVALDGCPRMLEVAKRKIERRNLADRIQLVSATAECIPFDSGRFDACTVGFGIRNFQNLPAVLREIRRVLRPCAKLAILELSEPDRGWLAPFARAYVHLVVPALGAVFSNRQEYRYLARSIRAFVPPSALAQMLAEVGLVRIAVTRLTCSVAHLYLAEVPSGTPEAQDRSSAAI